MKNLIKNVLLVVSGAGVALGFKSFIDKKTEEVKEDIYAEVDIDDILSMLENAEPGDERTLLIERCLHLMKTLYTAPSLKEARETMDILHTFLNSKDDVDCFTDEDEYDDVQGDEAGLEDVIEELSENRDINETVEIVPRKEKEDAGITIEAISKAVYEGELQLDEEENNEDDESEEVEPTVQSQKDISVEETTDEPECGEIGDGVDEEKFTYLAKTIISPLIERFGEDYEEKLTKMVWELSSPDMDAITYESYTNKLNAFIKYQKTGDKSKRKLDSIIEGFFNVLVSCESAEEEE